MTKNVSTSPEPAQWELLHRILKVKFKDLFKDEQKFISFNVKDKIIYNSREIQTISEANNHEFANFSNLVHQMPRSEIFENGGKLLWKEYQNLFYTAIPKWQKFRKTIKIVADKTFKLKEKRYKVFRDIEATLETKFVEALNENQSEATLQQLKKQLKNNLIEWKVNGHKDEIDHLYNQHLANSNYNCATLWNDLKDKALEADLAGYSGPKSTFGDFQIDFSPLKSRRWRSHVVRHKAIRKLLESNYVISENEYTKKLIYNIDKIKFDYAIVNIKRSWFHPSVFDSNCLQWHPNYKGALLSDGNLNGKLPSYITDLVFIKNIEYRKRSNFMLDLLEWIGGFLTELKMGSFIHNYSNEQFLIGLLYKKVPHCP